MKTHFLKLAVFSVMLFFAGLSANAQTTETFESQVPDVNYFLSGGLTFSLTNAFKIYSSRNGIGYNQSHRFVDNKSNPGLNQVNAIKSDGTIFSVKNLWLFVSTDGGSNPSTDGSLIIRGKRAGSVIFTITKTAGFNGSFGANNGFAYVNFVTEGAADYSTQLIDEVEFQLQGNFNYLGIDNFTWQTDVVLPTSLVSYSASLQNGKVSLNWKTSSESNSGYFVVERSGDGTNFKPLTKLRAAGTSSKAIDYKTYDENPLTGTNYYRLSATDLDGKSRIVGIELIKNNAMNRGACVYPNPVKGTKITLELGAGAVPRLYIIADISGKIVKTGIISSNKQPLNIASLASGSYVIKLSDGQVIQWVKQ